MELAATLHLRTLSDPLKPALITPHGTLNYAQLYRTAHELAGRIGQGSHTAASATPGPRIGLLATNPIDMIVGFYAGVLSGTSVVILDPAWPDLRLSSTIQRLELPQVICGPSTDSLLATLAPQVIRHRINRQSAAGPLVPPEHIDADHELMVVFTSGTTTAPKAIHRSRSSWQASVRIGSGPLHADAKQTTLVPGPLAHGLSLYAVIEALTTGGTAVVTGLWSEPAVRELMAAHRCTRVVAVPSILQKIVSGFSAELISSLQYVVAGGEALTPSLRAELSGLPAVRDVVEYYGTSEHSLIAYRRSEDRALPTTAGFTGRIFPSVDIQIRHASAETGIGEIFVHSPMIASGYHPSSGVAFRRNGPALSVQDHGRISGGVLQLAGRAGGMINLGGNNLYPSEINEALIKALGLNDTRVLLSSGAKDQPRLVAFVLDSELTGSREPSVLHDRLARELPKYKIPHELGILQQWPMTNSGKIATSQLFQHYVSADRQRVVLR